ncbi:hypothetical protein SGUI_0818 [Serinicoccus hydrothermalis]|uniref:Uncharacterized protein n=1 Tax=Serinicoccus hydrothermalis TaxID=1758689 RepID=A0A1B1N9X4_9MICO|nr:hypothetical protein SGUI_0818 [Serinicoccus hydrothermalis]
MRAVDAPSGWGGVVGVMSPPPSPTTLEGGTDIPPPPSPAGPHRRVHLLSPPPRLPGSVGGLT